MQEEGIILNCEWGVNLCLFGAVTVVDCGELPPPENGDISIPDTTVGSEATFECSLGFILVGDDVRVCQANGKWSGKQPICIRKP